MVTQFVKIQIFLIYFGVESYSLINKFNKAEPTHSSYVTAKSKGKEHTLLLKQNTGISFTNVQIEMSHAFRQKHYLVINLTGIKFVHSKIFIEHKNLLFKNCSFIDSSVLGSRGHRSIEKPPIY